MRRGGQPGNGAGSEARQRGTTSDRRSSRAGVTSGYVRGEGDEGRLASLGGRRGDGAVIPLEQIRLVSRARVGSWWASSRWTHYRVETPQGPHMFRVRERETANIDR